MEGKIDLLAEKWPQGKRLKYSVITEPHSYSISTDPSGGNLWAGFCQEIDLNIFTGSHQLHKVWKIGGFKSTSSYSREASTHNSPLNQPLMPMGSIWYPLNCKTSLYVTFLLPIFICKTPFFRAFLFCDGFTYLDLIFSTVQTFYLLTSECLVWPHIPLYSKKI